MGVFVFLVNLGFLVIGIGLFFFGVIVMGVFKSLGVFDLVFWINCCYVFIFILLLYLMIGFFFVLLRLVIIFFEIGFVLFVLKDL